MTNLLTRPIKRAVKKVKDVTYDTARAVTAPILAIASTGAYAYTTCKLNEIDNMPFLKREAGQVIYEDAIESLKKVNDYSAKGIGIAGALLIGKKIDQFTGTLPLLAENRGPRKLAQSAGYFGTAVLANVASGIERVKDLSLDQIALDTLTRAYDTAYNIANVHNGSDIGKMVSAGITGLVALTGVKLTDMFLRSKAVQTLYSLLIGNANDGYEERNISNHFKKKARKLEERR